MKRSWSKVAFRGRNNPRGLREGSAHRRWGSLLVIVTALALAAFGSTAPAAFGKQLHLYSGVSFGPEGVAGSRTFSGVQSIAVDQSSGNVFVYDVGAGTIFKFDAAGNPAPFSSTGTNELGGVGGSGSESENQFAIAPAGAPGGTAGDIYVANNSNSILIYSAAGSLLGELPLGEETCGVATDPAGQLITGSFSANTIREFTPTTNPPTSADQTGESVEVVSSLCNVAADGLGNIYAVHWNEGIEKLSGIAAQNPTLLDAAASTATVDPTRNEIYADRETEIAQYNSSEKLIGTFGAGRLAASKGLAVNATSGDVYVSNGGSGLVDIFERVVEPEPPAMTGLAAIKVGRTTATLFASINPRGFETTYHFEYLSAAAYEASGGFAGPGLVRTEETKAGDDENDHDASATIDGLDPGTVYRFRLVADSTAPGFSVTLSSSSTFLTRGGEAAPESGCMNETRRAESRSLSLPDCRAYELVTAGFKNGGNFASGVITAGSRVEAESFGNGFGGTESAGLFSTPYEFRRSEDGWSPKPLAAPASNFSGTNPNYNPLYLGVGANTVYGLRRINQPADAETLYRGHGADLEEIGPVAPPSSWHIPSGELSGNLSGEYFEAPGLSTPDTSHYVFTLKSPAESAPDYLWPADRTGLGGLPSLYEYVGANNTEPLLVGVTGGPRSTALIGGCGTSFGSYGSDDAFNAISSDGSVIFFTPWGGDRTAPCGSTAPLPATTELWARVDGETSSAHTVSISEPSSTDCVSCQTTNQSEATFQGASADGSRVFFLTEQELLPGDPGRNLYEYDFHGPVGERITCVSQHGQGLPAGVQGVVRVSADGSEVYFVASAALTSTPNSVGAAAVAGSHNLYGYDTETGTTKFVGTLSAADEQMWAARDVGRQAEATPDGRFLLFSSQAQLTPDDTSAVSQLFRYDSVSGQLVRISIGENGFNDNGNASIDPFTLPRSAGEYGGGQRLAPPKFISDDGEYVFFQSPTGLTPKALNDVAINSRGALAMNVYEYHSGAISLLSDGRDQSQNQYLESSVTLLGADDTGENVFFTTAAPLVPEDADAGEDIYDARIGGGLGRSAQAQCEAESCQAGVVAVPGWTTAGSSAFAGPGNPPSKHHKKKHHKKKHHKKKHHKKKHHKKRGGAGRSTPTRDKARGRGK